MLEFYKKHLQRGLFYFGKYDRSHSEPYSALMEALQYFCDDLLLRGEGTIANYKCRIKEAVGDEGILLTNAIHSLPLIIGQQSVITECNGRNAKNRFNYVLIKFIKAICSADFPLILILEDLQWMDSSSYDIISELVKDKSQGKNLMLLATYRENEVGNEHMVKSLQKLIMQQNVKMTEINLRNLDEGTVNEILSDSLSCTPFDAYALTALILKKTKGNPFFVKQVLTSLYEEGLIYLCSNKCKWDWKDTIFDEMDVTESVIELIRNKMLAFDDPTLMALRVA